MESVYILDRAVGGDRAAVRSVKHSRNEGISGYGAAATLVTTDISIPVGVDCLVCTDGSQCSENLACGILGASQSGDQSFYRAVGGQFFLESDLF